MSVRPAAVRRLLAALVLLGGASFARAQASIPAFPGAEGFGAYSNGGRGGDVYYVTNLNASGAGSFADAIATVPSAGRTIVFAVSGYIRFPSGSGGTRMTKGKVTIAGQTAPGDGIGFYNNYLRVSAPDVVMRHLRFRHGKNGSGGDCIDLDSGANRALLDHLAMQFSTDENMSSFSSAPDRLTLQYSINSWGLQSHSAGGLWDQNYATSLYNLWAHNHTRNPKARPWGLLEWVNNVTYDWNIGFIMGDSETPADWKANVLGNYFLCPPGNLRSRALEKANLDRNGNPNFTLYVEDNLFDKDGDTVLDGTDQGYGIASGSYVTAPARMSATGGTTVTPVAPRLAFKKVVSHAGPLRLNALSGVPLRDEVDTHQFDNVLNFRRNIITRESDLPVSNAGFGTLNSSAAPLDTDRDGMSDAFESALGWNLNVQDHNTALASSGGILSGTTFMPAGTPAGYTRLEEYLHFLASPHAIVARNTASEPTSLQVDLSRYTLGFNSLSPTFTLSGLVGGSALQSGAGGRVVTFTPTPNLAGRARFEFTVTDSQGDSWTQSFLILVSSVGAPRNLVWKGDGTTNTWNTSALHWTKTDGTAVAFASGDHALFDDRGSASPAIAIPANLTTGTLTFDTTKSYTLSGSGALFVGGPLTKRGTGSLTLANTSANTFGSVVHEAGDLVLTTTSSAGGGKLQLQGGALTLSMPHNSTIANAYEFNAPTTLNVTSQHTASGNWSGSGDVTLNTAAMWTVTGSWSAYSGRIGMGADARIRLNGNNNTNFGSAALAIDLGPGVGQFFNRNGNLSGDAQSSFSIGTLTGGPDTQLLGAQTGTGLSTYSIGGRGESATFAGSIRNGNGGGAGLAPTAIAKVGAGTWTLTGASTHTGATAVSAGQLRLNGSFSASPVTVASGAVLSGSGSVGGLVTVSSGGRLTPGAGDFAAGTFSAGGLTPASGSTLSFDLPATPAGTGDRLTLSGGTLTLAGTITFQLNFLDLAAGVSAGTYPLIDGAATLSASSPTMLAVPPATAGTTRQSFSLVRPASGANPAFVNLVVAGQAASLVWSGADGANWDLNNSAGNFTGASPSTFLNLDRVTFDDSAPGGTVNLTGTLQPALVTVANDTKAFTFAGSGLLSGGMRFVKNGPGTVTFANTSPNTFTGGVELNAGTLALGATVNPLGTGVIRVNGGTLQLANASTFLSNSLLFSGSSAIVSPYTGNSTLANSTANTFASDGPASLDLSGLAGILSINGSMSDFSGLIDLGAGSGMIRLNSNSSGTGDVNRGSAAAHFDLGGAGGRLVNRNGDITIELGALSGGPSTLLSGRQTGSGETSTTYRVGATGLDTTFAGQIQQGGDLSGVDIVKVGAGRWTLSGASAFVGSTTVEAGRLVVSGSLACTGGTEVGGGAELELAGGTLETESLTLAPGALLTGLGTIRGDLSNQGTISASGPGALTVTGDVVNDGVLRLTGGAELVASGAFVNNGVLDLLTADGRLPPNLVNNGTVIDASAARLASWSRAGTAFTLVIASYSGHTYTLETSADLAAGWTPVGEPRAGETGQELGFTHDAGPSAGRFYRIRIE